MTARAQSYGELARVLEELPMGVRQARTLFGLSQRDLAVMAGVSSASISRLESGVGAVSLNSARMLLLTLDKLARGHREGQS